MGRKNVSVLLVDDNSTFRAVAARFIKTLPGLTLIGTASEALVGLSLAIEICPDLVLVDLRMKDLSGLELIAILRQRLPKVRIIALSLQDPQAFRPFSLAAGANEFVDKATMFTDLLPVIERVCQPVSNR